MALTGGAGTAAAATAAVPDRSPTALAQPDTTPPTPPTNLRIGAGSTVGNVILIWDPSTDLPLYPPPSGIAAYDIYATGSPEFRLIGSVPGNVTTFVDTRRLCEVIYYFVRARDFAGNVSAPSNIAVFDPRKFGIHCPKKKKEGVKPGEEEHGVVHGRPESPDDFDHDEKSGHHHRGDDTELIKADRYFHVEGADDRGGGGHDDYRANRYGGHDFGPGAGAEAESEGGHLPGGQHAVAPAARALPLTGAPVAVVAGVGGVLLIGGAGAVLIAMRRRRTAGTR
ncbi:hypothetical protein ACFFWE_26365 [Sphaerisporangium melleum]|uniref:hypothetical protein n=1 Tax=Sphaerisporangium melleum TaxID=321316 RepID=UPI001666E2A3|nr:hypothetical protein [Sphaerisporangium melleum]